MGMWKEGLAPLGGGEGREEREKVGGRGVWEEMRGGGAREYFV